MSATLSWLYIILTSLWYVWRSMKQWLQGLRENKESYSSRYGTSYVTKVMLAVQASSLWTWQALISCHIWVCLASSSTVIDVSLFCGYNLWSTDPFPKDCYRSDCRSLKRRGTQVRRNRPTQDVTEKLTGICFNQNSYVKSVAIAICSSGFGIDWYCRECGVRPSFIWGTLTRPNSTAPWWSKENTLNHGFDTISPLISYLTRCSSEQ